MHAFLRASSGITLAVALTGCARYQPRPLNVDRELIDLHSRDVRHVIVDRQRPGQGTPQASTTFDATDGLDEEEVVAIALSLNPDLRAKRAELGASQAALITAGAWPNPSVGVGVRPGIDGASGTMVEADALFQLLRIGERDARRKSAAAGVDQTNADVIAAEFELVGEVRLQRLAILAADRKVALLKETLDLRQRAFSMVRRQRELGEATTLAMTSIELELAQANRALRQAEAALVREKLTLNHQLGLPPSHLIQLNGLGEPLRVTVFEDLVDEELDRQVVAGRFELRSSEAAYQKAEQELRLAVLQQYPSIGIGPAFEREMDGNKSFGLAVSIELPLLNQNEGPIAEKRSAREQAHAQYSALLHRLRAEAFEARTLLRVAKAEVDAQERDVLPLLLRNQELLESAYSAREINIIDWITAQQRAVDARQEYLDALVQYRRAVIRLETAMGQYLSSTSTTHPTTQPN